jgi:hypothetical protein
MMTGHAEKKWLVNEGQTLPAYACSPFQETSDFPVGAQTGSDIIKDKEHFSREVICVKAMLLVARLSHAPHRALKRSAEHECTHLFAGFVEDHDNVLRVRLHPPDL